MRNEPNMSFRISKATFSAFARDCRLVWTERGHSLLAKKKVREMRNEPNMSFRISKGILWALPVWNGSARAVEGPC